MLRYGSWARWRHDTIKIRMMLNFNTHAPSTRRQPPKIASTTSPAPQTAPPQKKTAPATVPQTACSHQSGKNAPTPSTAPQTTPQSSICTSTTMPPTTPAPQTTCPLSPGRQARKAASTSTPNCKQHGRQSRKAAPPAAKLDAP